MAESSIKKFCEDKKHSREKVMVYSNFLSRTELDYKEVESLQEIPEFSSRTLYRGDKDTKQLWFCECGKCFREVAKQSTIVGKLNSRTNTNIFLKTMQCNS